MEPLAQEDVVEPDLSFGDREALGLGSRAVSWVLSPPIVTGFMGLCLWGHFRHGDGWSELEIAAFGFGPSAVGIAFTAWCWAGRTPVARAWAQQSTGAGLALVFIPGLSFLLVGLALQRLTAGIPSGTAGLAFAIAAWFGVVAVAGGGDCPHWWGPRWFRHQLAEDEIDQDDDALGALWAACEETPVASSAREAAHVHGAAPVRRSWPVGWVYDPESRRRDHAFARRGTVRGALAVSSRGLVFAAAGFEDRRRGEPVVQHVELDAIRQITVAPARAGSDGVSRRGFLFRSPWPRLLVRTRDGDSLVFEVSWGRARHVAAVLSGLGLPVCMAADQGSSRRRGPVAAGSAVSALGRLWKESFRRRDVNESRVWRV